MKMTPETPTEPGYYLWQNEHMSKPWTAEIFKHEESGDLLFIETDNQIETLCAFCKDMVENNAKLKWCRLIPHYEVLMQ